MSNQYGKDFGQFVDEVAPIPQELWDSLKKQQATDHRRNGFTRAKEITSEEFRERRKALGLSQDSLAILMGMGRRAIQRMEKEKRPRKVYELALRAIEYELKGAGQ